MKSCSNSDSLGVMYDDIYTDIPLINDNNNPFDPSNPNSPLNDTSEILSITQSLVSMA